MVVLLFPCFQNLLYPATQSGWVLFYRFGRPSQCPSVCPFLVAINYIENSPMEPLEIFKYC